MPADTILTYGTSVDSLLSTTLSSVQKRIADNVFVRYPLWYYLKDKNKVTLSGGATIILPIMSGTNATAASYNAYDTLDTTPQQGIVAAQFTWKQYSVSISLSGREQRQNSGKEAIISLLEAKTKQAELSLARQLDIDAWAATQVTGRIGALPVIVDDTGSVADISGTTQTWWRSTDTASGSFAARGLADMRALYNTLSNASQENGSPDFTIAAQGAYEFYEASLQPQQRFSDEKMAGAGFQNLRYKASSLTFGSNVPSGTMYMLRTENLWLICHNQANFVTTEFVKPANQDAKVAQILFMGEIVTDNRRKLGRLTGITA